MKSISPAPETETAGRCWRAGKKTIGPCVISSTGMPFCPMARTPPIILPPRLSPSTPTISSPLSGKLNRHECSRALALLSAYFSCLPRPRTQPVDVLARSATDQSTRHHRSAGRVLHAVSPEGGLHQPLRFIRHSHARLSWSDWPAVQPNCHRPVGPRELQPFLPDR